MTARRKKVITKPLVTFDFIGHKANPVAAFNDLVEAVSFMDSLEEGVTSEDEYRQKLLAQGELVDLVKTRITEVGQLLTVSQKEDLLEVLTGWGYRKKGARWVSVLGAYVVQGWGT